MNDKQEVTKEVDEFEVQKENFEKLQQQYYAEIVDAASLDKEKKEAVFSMMHKIAKDYKEIGNKNLKIFQMYDSAGDELEARMKDINKSTKKHLLLKPAPANSYIDQKENEINSFAKGVNTYKICLLLFIGSFVGVVIETIWCLFTNGYIESRQGLVWGPFNLLYGVGALVLTLTLYRYRNRSSSISFYGGMVVGSILEYFCSLFQEILIGSTSWDYSSMPFNLDGRICLAYSIFWGILGVVWIKSIYPRIARFILRIPNKIGKPIVVIMTVFLALNSVVSLFAVQRWTQRREGIQATNSVEILIDEKFPDNRMEEIYANMEFKSDANS